MSDPVSNANLDDSVEGEIAECLNLGAPRSFFLFAGAGSGKTSSLVNGINVLRERYGEQMRGRGQKIGVITFTNAASEEITRRTKFDPSIHVSTIHSFAWSLIRGYDGDIKRWVEADLKAAIAELTVQEQKGRAGTKASATRQASIASKQKRLAALPEIKRFIYSPTGDNRSRDSLNHAEVIGITSDFLKVKPTLQKIVTSRFPFILVDESQDTNHNLIDALFALEKSARGSFGLGFFGDTMQQIYSDGKARIERELPPEWAKPVKKLNHRCPKRIVTLINRIRSSVDDQQQVARSDSPEGLVRFFCLSTDTEQKGAAEQRVAEQMAEITGDANWGAEDGRKTLILEHHMAARRMGFGGLFTALGQVEDYRTGLLDGTLPATSLFAKTLWPFLQAHGRGDKFAVGKIVRDQSPLMSKEALQAADNQKNHLAKVRDAANSLAEAFASDATTFRAIAAAVKETGLFNLPEVILAGLARDPSVAPDPAGEADDPLSLRELAIDAFLDCPIKEIEPYWRYVSSASTFDTHQGVKGLEFPRVMVVIDDQETRGFMFNYEKLFESVTPGSNEEKGSTAERTRRLLYVICSRAKHSLAIVGYSKDPFKLSKQVIESKLFEETEVIIFKNDDIDQ